GFLDEAALQGGEVAIEGEAGAGDQGSGVVEGFGLDRHRGGPVPRGLCSPGRSIGRLFYRERRERCPAPQAAGDRGGAVKERIKHILMRVMRPGLAGVEKRLDRMADQLAALQSAVEQRAGVMPDRDKYREELAYWRWLIKTEQGRASLFAPFDVAFGGWQRDRLRERGR